MQQSFFKLTVKLHELLILMSNGAFKLPVAMFVILSFSARRTCFLVVGLPTSAIWAVRASSAAQGMLIRGYFITDRLIQYSHHTFTPKADDSSFCCIIRLYFWKLDESNFVS